MWAVSDGMCQGAEVVKAVLLPAMQNSSSVSQHCMAYNGDFLILQIPLLCAEDLC